MFGICGPIGLVLDAHERRQCLPHAGLLERREVGNPVRSWRTTAWRPHLARCLFAEQALPVSARYQAMTQLDGQPTTHVVGARGNTACRYARLAVAK